MRLSEVIKGHKVCHHEFDVNSIIYDRSDNKYHFDCICTLCGYHKNDIVFTEHSLKWNLSNVHLFNQIEIHEYHTFARPEDVSDVRFGD